MSPSVCYLSLLFFMSQNGHLGRVSSHPLRETKDERISWEMELGWKNLGRVSSRPGLEREWNIAFARGGTHLPIAHILRLPETEIISWGGDFSGVGDFLGQEIF